MYNPRITEAVAMYERMVNKHKDDLWVADLIWEPFKDPDEYLVQVVPRLVMKFKG